MYTISNATDHAHEQKMILYTKYIDYTDMSVFKSFTTSFQKILVKSTRLKENTILHTLK